MNERDSKVVQYLTEAYGKERELETALQAHISMTTKTPYKKRLKEHLRETKAHARAVERRIKQLGGGGVSTTLQSTVGKAMAAGKGPLHALRGSGEQEKMLKNAKTEYFNEHEEISNYMAIETLAERVGDSETAKLARGIRREEERMARFLEGQIKSLTGAVVADEVPAAQRRRASSNGGRRRTKPKATTKAKPKAKPKPKAATGRRKATSRKASKPKSTRKVAPGKR